MKLKFLLIASLALFGLISCEKSEETPKAVLPADNVIRVSAGINALSTRAGVVNETFREFGMFVTHPNNETYTFKNVGVTKSSDIWTTKSVMLWENATEAVSIVAYAPYISEISALTDNTVTVKDDQSKDENVTASDFLYAVSSVTPNTTTTTNDIYYDATNKQVVVALSHHFSKLVVKITLGSEFNKITEIASNPLTNVSINGTKTSATIDLTSGTITPSTDVSAITPFTATSDYTAPDGETGKAVAIYEAIIIPQTVESANPLSIEFMINGITYEWETTTTVTFATDNKYTLDLMVGKDVVASSAISVGDWETGTGTGEIVTE